MKQISSDKMKNQDDLQEMEVVTGSNAIQISLQEKFFKLRIQWYRHIVTEDKILLSVYK
jgi:hypothetical protein